MSNRTAALALSATALGIALFARRRKRRDVTDDRAHASRTVTVRASATRIHEIFQSPERLKKLFGSTQMEIVADSPGERYEWRTPAAAAYRGGGSLTFTPAPEARGVEARLAMHFEGPGAKAIASFQRLTGASPAQVAMETMREVKALAEAGEIPVAVRA